MVAPVPRLPWGRREPVGSVRLARTTAIITISRSHWLTLYLAIWLCIAFLGICVTSTRSFRASDTRHHRTARETISSTASYTALPLQIQSQHQLLWKGKPQECALSTHQGSLSGQPRPGGHRALGGTLAAVSLGLGKHFEEGGPISSAATAVTSAGGFIGALRVEPAAPSVGIPRVRSLFQSISALFSSISADIPDAGLPTGKDGKPKGSDEAGCTTRQLLGPDHSGLVHLSPTTSQRAEVVQETAHTVLSLKRVRAGIRCALQNVLQRVRGNAAGFTVRNAAGGNGPDRLLHSAEVPLPDGEREDGGSRGYGLHFHPAGANSGPVSVQKLSVLASIHELKCTDSQEGFVLPHGQQVQERDTEADGGTNASHADHDLSERSFLPVPDGRAQSSAGDCSASSSHVDSANTTPVTALRQGLVAEAKANEAGPSGISSTSDAVVAPVDVPSRGGNDYSEPQAPASHQSGINEPLSKAAGVQEPNPDPTSPITSAKDSTLHPTEVPADISMRLHTGGRDSHQADREKQPPLSFLYDVPSPSVAPPSTESPREESQGWQQQYTSQSIEGSAHQGQDISALPAAVADELLIALRGPLAQQVLALQALLALVAAESNRRATYAQACVALPGGSQHQWQPSPLKGHPSSNSSPIDRLLHGGLVVSLQRILSTPAPKPFWPRWLHRDVDQSSKEAMELLQMKLHALQILSLLASFGSDVEKHIAGHKALIRALDRIAARPRGNGERLEATSGVSHVPRKFSLGPSKSREDFRGNERLTESAVDSESAPPAGESDKPPNLSLPGLSAGEKSGNTRSDGALLMPHKETDLSVQIPNQSEVASIPRMHSQDSAYSPLAIQDRHVEGSAHSCDGGDAAELPLPEGSGHLRRGTAVSDAADDPLPTSVMKASPATQTSGLPYATSSSSPTEKLVTDTMLRTTAERLAFALLLRFGKQGGAAMARDFTTLNETERPPLEDVNDIKVTWWRSFLLPFRRRESVILLGRQNDATGKQSNAEHGTESSQLPENLAGTCTSAKHVATHAGGMGRPMESGVLSKCTALRFAFESSRPGRIAARAAAHWKRFCEVGISRSLKGLAGSVAKVNREAESKVFWIPVCLSAGDAGVWAAIAAVAGEDLAAAMKRRLAERLQTGEPQQAPTVGGDARLPDLSSEFLLRLQEARVESMQPSASLPPAAWGVLGVTMEERNSDKIAQQTLETSTGETGAYSSSPAEGVGVFAGNLTTKQANTHFRVTCLLTGRQPFQEFVQRLGIRTLLDAAASGKPETKTSAFQALAQLLRNGAPGVSGRISRELHSGKPEADIRLRTLEKGLTEAIVAPYCRGRWWSSKRDQVDRIALENLQLAALEFLYALCTNNEQIIQSLQGCASLRAALARVIRFCKSPLTSSQLRSGSSKGDSMDTGGSSASVTDEAVLLKVDKVLPPGERHTRVLQEHARPLRLATIVSSALGGQPKWTPRVAGQRGLRILALDGGGTRGVLTVALLKHIAASVGRELSEIFDIICGTSTGGIIAVLLGMEKASVAELETLYDTLISEIFVKDSAAVAGARLVVRQAYYDETLWESLLQRAFGDTRMIDFAADESVPKVFCLSTMVSTNPAKLVVWRNYNYPCTDQAKKPHSILDCFHRIAKIFQEPQAASPHHGTRVGKRYEGSCCVRVRDALRATTAAPGFFIGKKVGDEFFVDGALLANNPAAVAIAEAKALYPDVPIEAVVSIGTGQCSPERCDARTGWDGIFNQLVNAATNTESIHELLRELLPPSVYFRFNPEIEAVSIDETSKERLDGLKLAAKQFLDEPKNKEAIQRLSDILWPAHPLRKHSRSLVRGIYNQATSVGRWVQNVGAQSMRAVSRSIRGPLSPSDSSLLRLIKCCLVSEHGACNPQATDSRPLLRRNLKKELTHDGSECSDAAAGPNTSVMQDAADPLETKGSPETSAVKEMATDDSILNLDARVVAGGRRSFLAWLLRTPRSKVGQGSGGIFDMLELMGRRHLSSSPEEELESLVPLTGVRHVLHGIFQLVRDQI